MNYYNRHYLTTDVQGRITSGWSDGPSRDRDTTEKQEFLSVSIGVDNDAI